MALPSYRVRLLVGGILACLGAFWTVASILFFFTRDVRDAAPVNLALALLLLALPGAALWLSGRARRRRHELMAGVASVARAAGRARVEDVARAADASLAHTRRALLDAVAERVLAGRLDLATDTFVPTTDGSDALPQETTVACARCGGTSVVVVTGGEARVCRYCGASA